MHILDVIPAKIPKIELQVLSYFSPRSLPAGTLVRVSIGRQKVNALAVAARPLDDQKMRVKSARFQTRNMEKIISAEPVLNSRQISLMRYLADYYAVPLPLILKTFLPGYLLLKKTPINLTPAQTSDSEEVSSKPILVIGVGREKYYESIISDCLKSGRQVLFLVPEISLVEKYEKLFSKYDPVTLTGELSPKNFFNNWDEVRKNKAKLIIGTRAAVFANFSNLRLIIMDNEHSPSYKSWDMAPYYDTKVVAKKMAGLYGAQLVLGSVTPAVETYYAAETGEISVRRIPDTDRSGAKPHPLLIDMNNEIFGKNYSVFSLQMQKALEKIISSRDKKALLFVSRRGYESFYFCSDCGHFEKCAECDAHLVYHALPKKILVCHRCGWRKDPPPICAKCGGSRIRTFGTGTQKVKDEIEKLWQYRDSLTLDYDTAPTHQARQKILDDFREKDKKILIATQAVIGKPDIPKADLVGVVSLDNLLYLPDYKIEERLFRLLNGLLDCAAGNGEFLFQTLAPENEAINLAAGQNHEKFYRHEIEHRKKLSYPPFSDIVKITVKDFSQVKARQKAENIAAKLDQRIKTAGAIAEVFGPIPVYIPKVKKKYIYQIILKIKKIEFETRSKMLKEAAAQATVDVGPESLI